MLAKLILGTVVIVGNYAQTPIQRLRRRLVSVNDEVWVNTSWTKKQANEYFASGGEFPIDKEYWPADVSPYNTDYGRKGKIIAEIDTKHGRMCKVQFDDSSIKEIPKGLLDKLETLTRQNTKYTYALQTRVMITMHKRNKNYHILNGLCGKIIAHPNSLFGDYTVLLDDGRRIISCPVQDLRPIGKEIGKAEIEFLNPLKSDGHQDWQALQDYFGRLKKIYQDREKKEPEIEFSKSDGQAWKDCLGELKTEGKFDVEDNDMDFFAKLFETTDNLRKENEEKCEH